MKKTAVFVLALFLALSGYAAGNKTTAKTAKQTAVKSKPTAEFVVVETADYEAGKYDPRLTAGIAEFLESEPNVTVLTYEQAQQDPAFSKEDLSFLPRYFLKKTPAAEEKLKEHLKRGYVHNRADYFIFPKDVSRSGVYQDKIANPGVLEIFVMSQCPYGTMAEDSVIKAQKEGKIPADKTIKLRYIVSVLPDGSIQSLHGSAEWEENVRQLLIAKYYPEKLWKYLEIRNKDVRSSRWDKAMEEAGINTKKIMKKFDTEGIELLKAEAAYSREYNINASPSFLWEGKEALDFSSVSKKPGLEFLNPSRGRKGQAAPTGSC